MHESLAGINSYVNRAGLIVWRRGMKRHDKSRNGWFYVAFGALIVSIISLFTPIVVYTEGMTRRSFLQIITGRSASTALGSSTFYGAYTILDFLGGERFVKEVLTFYNGEVLWRIDSQDVIVLAIIALVSLAASMVGICTMRSQYHRKWQFIMTVAGLAGTTLPSLLVFYAVNQSQKGFPGIIQCGIAPFVMPAAALVSIVAVVYRRSNVQRELKQRAAAENLIWTAGDIQQTRQGNYGR